MIVTQQRLWYYESHSFRLDSYLVWSLGGCGINSLVRGLFDETFAKRSRRFAFLHDEATSDDDAHWNLQIWDLFCSVSVNYIRLWICPVDIASQQQKTIVAEKSIELHNSM